MLICLYRALTSENPTQQHFPLTEEAFTTLHPSPRSKRNNYCQAQGQGQGQGQSQSQKLKVKTRP